MKVLITGASSGIGREMVKLLSSKYDEMILVARNQERLSALKDELSAISSAQIKIIATDLSEYKNCEKIYQENKNVDLLINNAGFGDYGKFDTTSLEKDIAMINTNIVALHTLTKLYLRDMKANNQGHILNVASIAGFMPGPLMATYYATKNYVKRLSEAIREELKREHSRVKISVLCPGPVETNFKINANINFNFYGASSQKIAQYAIQYLNRFYILPEFKIKLARFAMALLPSAITAKVVYFLQSKRNHVK